MISCISSIAVRENNQQLCFDKEINEEICMKQIDLAGFSFDEISPECISYVEKSCIFSFASKANPDTNITLECELYEDKEKYDCFWLRATIEQNPNICLNISSEHVKSYCIYYFAFRNHNKTLCDYCTESEKKDCEEDYDFIEKINDISDCDNVYSRFHIFSPGDGDEKCYLAFAIYHNDSTICSRYIEEGLFGLMINDYVGYSRSICMRYTR